MTSSPAQTETRLRCSGIAGVLRARNSFSPGQACMATSINRSGAFNPGTDQLGSADQDDKLQTRIHAQPLLRTLTSPRRSTCERASLVWCACPAPTCMALWPVRAQLRLVLLRQLALLNGSHHPQLSDGVCPVAKQTLGTAPCGTSTPLNLSNGVLCGLRRDHCIRNKALCQSTTAASNGMAAGPEHSSPEQVSALMRLSKSAMSACVPGQTRPCAHYLF